MEKTTAAKSYTELLEGMPNHEQYTFAALIPNLSATYQRVFASKSAQWIEQEEDLTPIEFVDWFMRGTCLLVQAEAVRLMRAGRCTSTVARQGVEAEAYAQRANYEAIMAGNWLVGRTVPEAELCYARAKEACELALDALNQMWLAAEATAPATARN